MDKDLIKQHFKDIYLKYGPIGVAISVPTGRLYTIEECETNNTQYKMKYKRAFVEFKHFDRTITIAVVANNGIVYIGHSIQNPIDTNDIDLGRKIAVGRALNKGFHCFELDTTYCYNYGLLKSIALIWKARFIKHSKVDNKTGRIDYSEVYIN